MLKALVQFSLRFRGTVVALACLLIGYGIYIASRANFDVFPDFVPPQVVIQTESPGLSAEQVELLVTKPLENSLNGTLGVETLRSESIQGLSIITLVFKEGVSIISSRQLLGERLLAVTGQLPLGVKAPKMTPLTSATMDLLKIGMIATNLTPRELREFADWTMKPRLLAVPGVAKVSAFGGEVRQFQIQVRPEKLSAFNLTLSDIVAAARISTGVRGAGFVETSNQRVILETEGQAVTPERLGQTIVGQSAAIPLRLKDVANIVDGAEPKFGDTLVMGQDGVLLTMSSQYGANTLETTHLLEDALDEMRPLLDKRGIVLYDRLHRPATFIENSLSHMKGSLLVGAGLVTVVLLLFLFNLRTALISLTAIPLSLFGAVLIMDRFGVAMNTMTLGGLAIAIGEVVDDAIIDVENIFRRLREQPKDISGAKVFSVILDASLEVRGAVVFATFIVALVFVPVITLSGLQGDFFAPLGLAYVMAIMTSLLVALTVTPAMAALLLSRAAPEKPEPRWITRLKSAYEWILGKIFPHPVLLGIFIILLCLGGAFSLPYLGREFLPEFREGHFVAQINMAPGISLAEMRRLGRLMSLELLQNPHIATIEEQIGRAEAGEDPWGPNRAEFHIELKPVSAQIEASMADEIRETFEHYPGVKAEVLTFLGDRIGETISGEVAQVVISVFGNDLEQLDQYAREVMGVLKKIPGHADVQVKSPPGLPKIRIKLRPDRLREFGFSPVEVLDAVDTAYQGSIVAQVFSGEKIIDVAVILDPELRTEPESVSEFWVQNARGARVPLKELAEIDPIEGRAVISHDGSRRRQTITCNVTGRDVASFVKEAKASCGKEIKLGSEYYLAFSGTAEQESGARMQLTMHSGVASVGILLLLGIVLRNFRNLLLVLVNLPFAFLGGTLAVWLSSRTLSLGSLVGFVTLFGITLRNSIMLVSHLEHLIEKENQSWNKATVLRAASERLVPILMTALVTGLGLMPLALGGQKSGQEIESPMAMVILGGLVTSTFLNLLLLPALLWRFGRFDPPEPDLNPNPSPV